MPRCASSSPAPPRPHEHEPSTLPIHATGRLHAREAALQLAATAERCVCFVWLTGPLVDELTARIGALVAVRGELLPDAEPRPPVLDVAADTVIAGPPADPGAGADPPTPGADRTPTLQPATTAAAACR